MTWDSPIDPPFVKSSRSAFVSFPYSEKVAWNETIMWWEIFVYYIYIYISCSYLFVFIWGTQGCPCLWKNSLASRHLEWRVPSCRVFLNSTNSAPPTKNWRRRPSTVGTVIALDSLDGLSIDPLLHCSTEIGRIYKVVREMWVVWPRYTFFGCQHSHRSASIVSRDVLASVWMRSEQAWGLGMQCGGYIIRLLPQRSASYESGQLCGGDLARVWQHLAQNSLGIHFWMPSKVRIIS